MNRDSIYYKQVELLVRVLPFVAREQCFALKGGTAINLFVQDMPRLSVDIDLVYLPIGHREPSLAQANAALTRIQQSLVSVSPGYNAKLVETGHKIMVDGGGFLVKIEVSPVTRGTVHPPTIRDIHPEVEKEFGFASIAVASEPDLYGGKICAALDRQHPRDIYDVMLLMSATGITRRVFEAFLVYLISHRRPISELLNPNLLDIRPAFENSFVGMTTEPVKFQLLIEAREKLVKTIQQLLTDTDKQFLMSVKNRSPDWSLLPLEDIDKLPAVQWKLHNLQVMPADRLKIAQSKLQALLESV